MRADERRPQGVCGDCGETFAVRDDGTLRIHHVGNRRCPGSRRAPKSVERHLLHRCPCGATWDEEATDA